MSLLCFQGKSGSGLDSLAPVWALDPPVKYRVDITSWDNPLINPNISPDTAWIQEGFEDNNTSIQQEFTIELSTSIAKQSTVTVSEASRLKIGGKVQFEVSVKGKFGVPFIENGEITAKTLVESTTESEYARTVAGGNSVTRTDSAKVNKTVKAAPHTRVTCKAFFYKASVSDLKWYGTMTVIYAAGNIKTLAIDGTLDGVGTFKSAVFDHETPLSQ